MYNNPGFRGHHPRFQGPPPPNMMGGRGGGGPPIRGPMSFNLGPPRHHMGFPTNHMGGHHLPPHHPGNFHPFDGPGHHLNNPPHGSHPHPHSHPGSGRGGGEGGGGESRMHVHSNSNGTSSNSHHVRGNSSPNTNRPLWSEHQDDSGKTYYFNSITKESSWDKPDDLKSDFERRLDQSDWTEYKDPKGRTYYHNTKSNVTSWDLPDDLKSNKPQPMEQEPSVLAASPHIVAPIAAAAIVPVQPSIPVQSTIPVPTVIHKTTSPSVRQSMVDLSGDGDNSCSLTSLPSKATTPATESGEEDSGDDAPPAKDPHDVKELFAAIMKDRNVPSTSSWEFALKLIDKDPRFPHIKHHPERKQMFNQYKIQKAKDEKEELRNKLRKCRENLEKMLTMSDKLTSTLRYRTACDIFSDNDHWKAVQEPERREIFDDVVDEMTRRMKQKEKKDRERNIKALSGILDCMTCITYRTTWDDAQRFLVDNPVFASDAALLAMEKEDALMVFEEHIRRLEDEMETERRKDKVATYRVQRRNREGFIDLLNQLHKSGKLTSMSQWRMMYPEISSDCRFAALLAQPLHGSTALDLFKFYVDDLKARYNEDRDLIKDIMRRTRFEMSLETKCEDFIEIISSDTKSAKLDAGNVKLVYDRLMVKLKDKEKERLKEEARKRKKRDNNFMTLLHNLDPQVNKDSVWEQVRKAIDQDDAFLAIDSEEDRLTLFQHYVTSIEESCSHHHARSKKKKDKRKKEMIRRGNESESEDSLALSPPPHRASSLKRKRDTKEKSRSRSRSKRRSASRSGDGDCRKDGGRRNKNGTASDLMESVAEEGHHTEDTIGDKTVEELQNEKLRLMQELGISDINSLM